MPDVFDELATALTIPKAALAARICAKNMRDHVSANRIRVLRVGGKTLIPLGAIRDFVRSIPVASQVER